LTFQDAQLKLLAYVRDRIQNGEWTERGFARRIGISQPHVHNVLKGVRNLSPEILESILKYFHMSLLDLATVDELEANLKERRAPEHFAEVASLEAAIGPGMPWPAAINWRHRFPLPFRSQTSPAGLVMARLVADPHMYATLGDSDIALLDTSGRSRSHISPEGLYVVIQGDEALLRHVRPGAQGYYLVTDTSMASPAQWERLRVVASELTKIVKARVRWLGRERDRDLALYQRGRFL
jgi:transcriptional regulator with XRE-family HTH domain